MNDSQCNFHILILKYICIDIALIKIYSKLCYLSHLHTETSYDSSWTVGPASSGSTDGAQTPDSVDSLADVGNYETTDQVAKALIEFLVTRLVGFARW